ncbi:MAG: ribonuclease HI [Clostridiales bacterium]|nr:ribonuclease HI [Clostridiales bacterium]
MTLVHIYTDGACRGNPGPGGWAAILVTEADGKKIEKELSGGEKLTTNNRMELTAAIKGLAALKYRCKVVLTSDSKYLCDAVNLGWAKSWQKRGWIKSDKKPALNPDLWERLLELLDAHDVETVWVRGHAGHEYNERCDALATAMADSFKD